MQTLIYVKIQKYYCNIIIALNCMIFWNGIHKYQRFEINTAAMDIIVFVCVCMSVYFWRVKTLFLVLGNKFVIKI